MQEMAPQKNYPLKTNIKHIKCLANKVTIYTHTRKKMHSWIEGKFFKTNKLANRSRGKLYADFVQKYAKMFWLHNVFPVNRSLIIIRILYQCEQHSGEK